MVFASVKSKCLEAEKQSEVKPLAFLAETRRFARVRGIPASRSLFHRASEAVERRKSIGTHSASFPDSRHGCLWHNMADFRIRVLQSKRSQRNRLGPAPSVSSEFLLWVFPAYFNTSLCPKISLFISVPIETFKRKISDSYITVYSYNEPDRTNSHAQS